MKSRTVCGVLGSIESAVYAISTFYSPGLPRHCVGWSKIGHSERRCLPRLQWAGKHSWKAAKVFAIWRRAGESPCGVSRDQPGERLLRLPQDLQVLG